LVDQKCYRPEACVPVVAPGKRATIRCMHPSVAPSSAFAAAELAASVAQLATMSDLCVQILQWITQGEERGVFPLTDQLRQMRSGLADFLERKLAALKDFQPSSPVEHRQIEQLRLGVRIVATFDKAHAEWSQRLEGPDTPAESWADASVDAWHALIEKRLPRVWDLRKDVLAIVGRPPDALVQALDERGQQRVLVFPTPAPGDPAEASPPDAPGPASQRALLSQRALFDAAVASGRLRSVDSLDKAKQLYFFLEPPHQQEVILADPGVDETFHTRVKDELDTLLLMARVGENTQRVFGPRWFNQGLDNLPIIANSRPLAELRGRYAGVPAVLVSPGPSLDRNIAHLKGIQGKAILMAPGQSIKRLHQENIYPDFVAVIDPQDLTSPPFPFFDAALICDHQALVAGVTCHPNVLRLPYRRKYVFGSSSSAAWIDAIFGDAPVSSGGTSVAVAALNMLIEWGCNPIVLVGQDLAYSEGRQYAGAGATASANGRRPDSVMRGAVFEVEGYYGGSVRTPYGYKAALYEMETIAERLALLPSAPLVLNATEGGASIRGFAKQPLADVVGGWGTLTALSSPVWPADPSDPDTLLRRQQRGEHELRRILDAVRALTERASECAQLCTRIQSKGSARLLERLGKAEKKMRALLRLVGFLSLALQEEVEHLRASISGQSDLADNLKASAALYAMILSACRIADSKIAAALELPGAGNTQLP